ncbi:MAG: Phosphoserine phosphatase RsbU [Bacteroidota bacterium]|jgi:sigma-B regulation protein RsbU (phosphoserine phosphatase)
MQQGLKEKIKQRDFKLQSLLDITKAINADVHIDALLALYQNILVEQLLIGKILLVSTQENPFQNLIIHGFEDAQRWHPIIEESNKKNKAKIETTEANGTQVVIVPIEKDGLPIAFVILGDNNEEALSVSPSIKHMRFVQTLTSVLIVAIQNKKLIAENIAQAALKRELELAAEMQNMLLPKLLPKTTELSVNAYYKSHGQVGGDYYDFIEINNHEWICCMADVSGKGVSAAFLMAGLQAQLRGLIDVHGNHLEKIVAALNAKVLDSAQGEKFVTFFIGHFDSNSKIFSYINCGHNPVIVYQHASSSWLSAQTPGLGIVEKLPHLSKKSLTIAAGTHLLLYTDGLVEVENENLISFGENGVERAFQQWGQKFSNESLIEMVTDFIGKMKFIDDIALLHIVIQ